MSVTAKEPTALHFIVLLLIARGDSNEDTGRYLRAHAPGRLLRRKCHHQGPPQSCQGGYRHQAEEGRRSEEHTSELQSRENLVCRLLLEKKKKKKTRMSQRCN